MNPRRPMAAPSEVATFINKPVGTLKQWRIRKIGPRYYRIGRDVRYDWADVDEWLHGRRSESSAA